MNYQCIAICNGKNARDFDRNRLYVLQEKCARINANHRREVVARQKRTLIIMMITIILGVFLALSIGRTDAQATGADQANDTGYRYYKEVRVENGDSLWSIAEDYTDGSFTAVTECVEDMQSINHLSAYETIKAGDYVIVPYYSDEYIE